MSEFMKPTDKKAIIRSELQAAKKHAVESIEIGAATLEKLDQQEETLQSVSDNLDKNEEVLIKSMKALRGMTWTGSMYNAYSNVKDRVIGTGISTANLIKSSAGTDRNLDINGQSSDNQLTPPKELWIKTEKVVEKSEDDKDLEDISRAVSTLHRIGMTMTEHLDSNDTLLETIEDKTDKVNEKTLQVTLRSSQLVQRSNKSGPQLIGRYMFTEVTSGCFLAAIDGNMIMSSFKDDHVVFDVWVKENNLMGIQSVKSEKFIGATFWGSVEVSGNYFGKQEEIHIELDGRQTGLLFLSKNWGAGGWLRWATPSLTFEEFFAATKNIPLKEVTADLADRKGAVMLKAHKIS